MGGRRASAGLEPTLCGQPPRGQRTRARDPPPQLRTPGRGRDPPLHNPAMHPPRALRPFLGSRSRRMVANTTEMMFTFGASHDGQRHILRGYPRGETPTTGETGAELNFQNPRDQLPTNVARPSVRRATSRLLQLRHPYDNIRSPGTGTYLVEPPLA